MLSLSRRVNNDGERQPFNRWNAWQTFVSALTRSCASVDWCRAETYGYLTLALSRRR
jgi:hypothetical protein